MTRRLMLLGFAALVCAAPALAILGVGDIVYDPTSYEEAIQMLAQMAQQYEQLVETYHLMENQYDQMLRMAKQDPVNMFLRYRAVPSPWTRSAATNTYGTTSAWTVGINTGQNVSAGYANATEPLSPYGGAFSSIPADQTDHIKTGYATVELTDGANRASMQTVGDIRGNALAVETAIRDLESDSLSSDPAMNTEIAVLNKINAANVIGLRNTQDTNKLLVALTEQQTVQAKRQRDAEAKAFNEDVQFRKEAKGFMAAQASNASAAMLAWRMP